MDESNEVDGFGPPVGATSMRCFSPQGIDALWAAIETYRNATARLTATQMRALAGGGAATLLSASSAYEDAKANLRHMLGMEAES
jgi:hypothetical protein